MEVNFIEQQNKTKSFNRTTSLDIQILSTATYTRLIENYLGEDSKAGCCIDKSLSCNNESNCWEESDEAYCNEEVKTTGGETKTK